MNLTETILGFIQSDQTSWNGFETVLAKKILEKLANCRKRGLPVPPEVFEAHCKGTNLVNSDVAILDPQGRIYLAVRGANEQWAGKLHVPGCTHACETLKQATQRLLETELKVFGLTLKELHHVGELLEIQDRPRGPSLSYLFIARVKEIPCGIQGHFYTRKEIPWKRLVASHRKVTIPWLIKHGYLK